MLINKSWDYWFLELAQHMSKRSKDPSTKCGAVIANGKKVISLGYNGFAAGCDDNPEIYNDRERKYKRVLHAEQNALLTANCTLLNTTCYVWPMPPCSTCTAMLIQAGIKRIVTIRPTPEQYKRWGDGFVESFRMIQEADINFCYLEPINELNKDLEKKETKTNS